MMTDFGNGFVSSRDRDVVGIGVFFQASPNPVGFVSQRRVMTDFGNGFDWSRDRDVVGIGVFFQASPNPGGFVSQRRVVGELRALAGCRSFARFRYSLAQA